MNNSKKVFIYKEKKISPLYEYENKYWEKHSYVYGIDEAGRGPLAGPVVVAAVVLNPYTYNSDIKDSKLLTKKKLLELYDWIIHNAHISVAYNHHRIIDHYNILQATKKTMIQAITQLHTLSYIKPEAILIDAVSLDMQHTVLADTPQYAFIKGESISASIAAASIIAKVTRDTIMHRLDPLFPQYLFHKHKGYGTALHTQSIQTHNASLIHRSTFIKKIISKKEIYD